MIAFLDPVHVELVRVIAAAANIDIIGAGSPTKGQSGTVAADLGCETTDDLRAALAERVCDAFLIVASGDFGSVSNAAGTDARAVLAAHARGIKIASFEPIPGSALDARGAWSESQSGAIAAHVPRLIGLPRHSRAMRDAAEPLAQFGRPRFLHAESLGRPEEGSLGARMLAVCDLVVSLMGEPETVEAAYVAPSGSMRGPANNAITTLRGDMCATMRFADGRAAGITASSEGARWNFGCTILGEQGRIRIHHRGFTWRAIDGEARDEMRLPEYDDPASRIAQPVDNEIPTAHLFEQDRVEAADPYARAAAKELAFRLAHKPSIEALSESLARTLDPEIPDQGPINVESVLAVVQAAMLSARTGQPEHPQTFRTVSVGGI